MALTISKTRHHNHGIGHCTVVVLDHFHLVIILVVSFLLLGLKQDIDLEQTGLESETIFDYINQVG